MGHASLSEHIKAAVICRLSGIRVADGYRTDSGLRVHDSLSAIDDRDTPALVVFEESEEPQADTGSGNVESMKLAITYTVDAIARANRADTGKVLQQLKADVKRALLRDRGGIAGEDGKNFAVIAYLGASANPRESGSMVESIVLRFRVTFKEAYGDPYASR